MKKVSLWDGATNIQRAALFLFDCVVESRSVDLGLRP